MSDGDDDKVLSSPTEEKEVDNSSPSAQQGDGDDSNRVEPRPAGRASELQELLRNVHIPGTQQNSNFPLRKGRKETYAFWGSQPVTQFDEVTCTSQVSSFEMEADDM